MGIVAKPFTFTAGATKSGEAAQVNADYDAIYAEFNGNIENANVKSNAAIAYSKLALTGALVNADVATAAAIAWSKISKSGSLLSDIGDFATVEVGVGAWGSRGLVALNNSGTPNTQFDLDADVVILRNSDNRLVVRYNPGAALTNNILTAGPAANGRDQAGAFSAGSWVHFYRIWNGTTLATLSSAVAPPTGPTLPATYTHWEYALPVRLNGSSQLVKTRCLGNVAYYDERQAALTGGSATTETNVDLSPFAPPNNAGVFIEVANAGLSNGAGELDTLNLRLVTGLDFAVVPSRAQGASSFNEQATNLLIPNVGQNLIYGFITTAQLQTHSANIWVKGYIVPNGGA